MYDAGIKAVAAKAGFELQHAARVRGGDDGRLRRCDITHLVIEQTHRHFALRETVEAGAPAAAVGRIHLHQLQAGDRTQ